MSYRRQIVVIIKLLNSNSPSYMHFKHALLDLNCRNVTGATLLSLLGCWRHLLLNTEIRNVSPFQTGSLFKGRDEGGENGVS